MADGASRLFNVIKSSSNNKEGSQFVNLSIRTLNPLTFTLDDRVVITSDFYVLDKNFSKSNAEVGQVVNAIVLNDNQVYYVLSNVNYEARIKIIEDKLQEIEQSL